jgi:hypothetical protein
MVGCIALGLMLIAGCRQDMHDQPRYEALESSTFFEDGRSSRPLVAGTVPRGYLRLDELPYTGKVGGELAETLPFPVTRELLERGKSAITSIAHPVMTTWGTARA